MIQEPRTRDQILQRNMLLWLFQEAPIVLGAARQEPWTKTKCTQIYVSFNITKNPVGKRAGTQQRRQAPGADAPVKSYAASSDQVLGAPEPHPTCGVSSATRCDQSPPARASALTGYAQRSLGLQASPGGASCQALAESRVCKSGGPARGRGRSGAPEGAAGLRCT